MNWLNHVLFFSADYWPILAMQRSDWSSDLLILSAVKYLPVWGDTEQSSGGFGRSGGFGAVVPVVIK